MEKVMEQPSVSLLCLYLLLYPSNIFVLPISLSPLSILSLTHCKEQGMTDAAKRRKVVVEVYRLTTVESRAHF